MVVWPAGSSAQAPEEATTNIKRITLFNGNCKLQLIKGFFPCDSQMIFTELRNGRSFLTFTKEKNVFGLFGGADRQPNPENYYLQIDAFRIGEGEQTLALDKGMEGECHFRLNKGATRFYSVKCDIYNRSKGSIYNFYLENIVSFTKKEFNGTAPQADNAPDRPTTSMPAPLNSDHLQIPLLTKGGTFVVPVQINGVITLDFIVDSGAADVSIPADVVSTLVRTGSIQDSDFTGHQVYEMADGSNIPSATFTLRSLKIGERIVENVSASVSPAKGEPLLGQSFLTRFRSWSIDNDKHVLFLH